MNILQKLLQGKKSNEFLLFRQRLYRLVLDVFYGVVLLAMN